MGSIANFITEMVLNLRGRQMQASSAPFCAVMVAVFMIEASTPTKRAKQEQK
jgi:hypothetical protein